VCKATTSGPKAGELGQEDAWGKRDFNEENEKGEEGNELAWETAAGSRDERIQPTTGKSKRERCVGKGGLVQGPETQLAG